MIPEGSYKQLDGAYYGAVVPYDKNSLYRIAFDVALYDIASHIAMVHDAPFNQNDFDNIVKAFDAEDIRGRFFVLAKNLCNPVIVGGEMHFLSLALSWEGRKLKAEDAEITEDFTLFPSALREFIKGKTEGKSPPSTGLAAFFDKECIEQMAKEGKVKRSGEFVHSNTKMIRVLRQSGTKLGLNTNDKVLSLHKYTDAMRNLWLPDVVPHRIAIDVDKYDLCNRRLVTSWSDGSGAQRLALGFTKTMSTINGGKPIIQAQFLETADNLPPVASLKDILTSLIITGHKTASDIRWGVKEAKSQPSPSIPFNGSSGEILAAVMSAGQAEIMDHRPNRSFVFGGIPPETHFSVLNQPKILAALEQLGLPKRMLGPEETRPGILDIEPKEPTRKLTVMQPIVRDKPYFELAA